MSNINLTEENRKIKEKLMWDFKRRKIDTNDFDRNLVNLIAEMVAEGIQLSQQNKECEEN